MIANITDKEYIGRAIIFGRHRQDLYDINIYIMTGRSPPSRARRFILDGDGTVRTAATNEEDLKKGNPKLLLYPCVKTEEGYLVASNGAQTDLITQVVASYTGKQQLVIPHLGLASILSSAFDMHFFAEGNKPGERIDLTSFEPDAPNWTPRIIGLMKWSTAALGIIREDNGNVFKAFYEFPLVPGRGKFISTYSGVNVPKGVRIPSFTGEPLDVLIEGNTPEEVAEDFYDALGPKQPGEGIISPGEDFRVGVAVSFIPTQAHGYAPVCHIINRVDRER